MADDVGRSSSKDDTGREAWELLDAPKNTNTNTTSTVVLADEHHPPTWDNAPSIKTMVDSSRPTTASHNHRGGVGFRGSGESSDHYGSFAKEKTAGGRGAVNPAEEESTIAMVATMDENSVEWDMKVLERKQVHSDAVSGCALVWEPEDHNAPSTPRRALLVTCSLDGGLTVHRVSLENTNTSSIENASSNDQPRGLTSTLSRFTYGTASTMIQRHLNPTAAAAATTRFSEYRSHTSRDPLASLAVTYDKGGGSIAFTGGHDDVVLAYGIKSACAVASVYSHRDAVTGLAVVDRATIAQPQQRNSNALWLDNATHILVSGSWDATVKVWSAAVATGETVAIQREPLAELFDADASIVTVAVQALGGDGIAIAAGCQDGSFCVWTIDTDGVQVQIHSEPSKKGSGPCSVVHWAQVDGVHHLYTAYSTGTLASYILVDGATSLRRESAVSVGVAVSALLYIHVGGVLLLGCADGGLRLVPLRNSTYFEGKPTLWRAVHNKKTSPGISTLGLVHSGNEIICCTGADDGSITLFELKRAS